jgi:hypothetical protein
MSIKTEKASKNKVNQTLKLNLIKTKRVIVHLLSKPKP